MNSKDSMVSIAEYHALQEQVTALQAELKRKQARLDEQHERFQVLTENMREGLILIGESGKILTYNSAALQLLGVDAPADGATVYQLNESLAFRETVSNAEKGIHGETVIYIGETVCQLIANPVANDSLKSGAVLVLFDITEREKRDALRREFTSNVSHELKTPLTSIYGIADMLESGMVKAEDITGFSRRIRTESARMIALIEDIIRLSRLDDESFSEETVPLDIYDVAAAVLVQLENPAAERNVGLSLKGEPLYIQGVPVIVEEMIYNLCDNAIKYNVQGGSVTITVTQKAHFAVVSVADTGIGIAQADRERIFERFYRVDKSHSRQIGGTGLGLSIVKHGAAFHNAQIELESQLGKGTTISLLFPIETTLSRAQNFT